ncbi:hypothetical protein EJ02DRAFT_416475 [Clathrospora elynae]|uniref:Uncharacterized protein n=1 Tax=Clathrospora elynae TaxID=706981 RepID=A0A6A5S5T8_9PLEO|nr:hypothetical protein EJ02DRAFT_416475 [Clathrospora elynae]
MEDDIFTPLGTASAVLKLSKVAWRLGIALSKLDQDAQRVDSAIQHLAGDVKSLGNECDSIYTKLDEVVSRSKDGSPPPYDGDGRMWNCLAAQVGETSRLIHELELFIKSVRMEETDSLVYQPQRLKQLDKSNDQIGEMGAIVRRHTDNFRTTLQLISTVLAHLAPHRSERPLLVEVEQLQDMVKKLQRSTQIGPPWRHTHTEVTLMQYAQEAIEKGRAIYEANLAAAPVVRSFGTANSNTRTTGWMSALESLRRDQQNLEHSDPVSKIKSTNSADEAHAMHSTKSSQNAAQDGEGSDSEDDLDTDLAKSALDTGTKAFEAQEWDESNSLLQEALRVLQQLPNQRRAFCDIFYLHYQLAVCAYHTQEHVIAEGALLSLIQQSTSSNEQRGCIHHATHLLSQLYICMGQVNRARAECEKALQARRRLLGKQCDASLESMALMAHIYVLLNNRALAKSCLAMIPEARRDAILRSVENSLGTKVEHLDFSSLLSGPAVERARSRLRTSTLEQQPEHREDVHGSALNSSPAISPQQSHQHTMSLETCSLDLPSMLKTSPLSVEDTRERRPAEKERRVRECSSGMEALHPASSNKVQSPEVGHTLTRKEILDKVGCQPRDRIEEAVCAGDYAALSGLLNKKMGFWRSVRKRGRPERVTALHFAALFGEVEMARRLLDADFNINEVPFGYTTSLTPLNFAIGARQVAMADFLCANGAKPSEPDTWSSLAGQLMSRSWLMKTMSESERESVPDRITAIMAILLKHGWDVNAPLGESDGTVLHQAVSFWTGSYQWDLSLRAAVTSFLCKRGANPCQVNKQGKTPYDMASVSGHQDLLKILSQKDRPVELFELPGQI